VKRGPYAKVATRNATLLEHIRALKAKHPFWGYRRIWAHLRYVDGLRANQKRVYGLMKAADSWSGRTPSCGPGARATPGSRGRRDPTSGGGST
jgi:HTH-like domain